MTFFVAAAAIFGWLKDAGKTAALSETISRRSCYLQLGELIRSFGEGLLIWPHGIFVDEDNNVWITDA